MQNTSLNIKFLALTLGLFAFASCSQDEVEQVTPKAGILHPILGANNPFVFTTRANPFEVDFDGTAHNYEGFDQAYPTPINPEYKNIGVFSAQDSESSYPNPIGQFTYPENPGNASELNWESNVPVENGVKYYVYGFMPNNFNYNIGNTTHSATQSITRLSGTTSWADGAHMTFTNLPAVTGADICAIVGVKPGNPAVTSLADQLKINDTALNWTNAFQFYTGTYADTDCPADVPVMGNHLYKGIEGDHNCVYLLLDHLYSNINLELYVDKEYSALRTIEITQVKMRSAGTVGRINLTADVTNASPYIQNLDYTTVGSETAEATLFPIPPTNTTVIVEAEGNYKKDAENNIVYQTDAGGNFVLDAGGNKIPVQLYTSIPGYFAPASEDIQFTFEFTYKVYDAEGNLVRENAKATNHWTKTKELLQAAKKEISRGLSFQVKVKVAPTYLYQLSSPDLDTPTFTIETVTP